MIELTSFLLALLTAISSLALAMLYFKATKEKGYNIEKNRVEIETLRASYESKIYEMMDRVISTESRWKDVNHLLISAQSHPPAAGKNEKHLSSFLRENGLNYDDLNIEKDLVFVLTPYHERHEETFFIISETCRSLGLKAVRGDEQHIRGDILSHTLKLIAKARIIIANIDGRNPNVFYELGVAHALDKNVILISSTLDTAPVDIKSQRMIIHKEPATLKEALKSSITKSLISPIY